MYIKNKIQSIIMYLRINFLVFFYRECTRLCEGIGLRAHTFTKINKDKEKFNPKLAKKFGNCQFDECLYFFFFY